MELLVHQFVESLSFTGKTCVSNDQNLMKYLLQEGLNVCKADYNQFIKNKTQFNWFFYKDDYRFISPQAIIHFYEEYEADILILNKSIYGMELLPGLHEKTKLVVELEELQVFEFQGDY